ncbi:MAG: hypothetical protein ACK5ZS_01535 [bacterium]
MKNTSYISSWDANIAVSPETDGVWLCIMRSGASVYVTLEPAEAVMLADALRAAAIVNTTEPAQVAE